MKNDHKKIISPRILIYLMLTIGGITMVFPFIWMLSTSFKSSLEVLSAQISLIPERKKYIQVDGELEQVEFSVARELQKTLSIKEGKIIETFSRALPAQSRFKSDISNKFSLFRVRLEKYFHRFQSRAEISAALHKFGEDTVGKLPSLPSVRELPVNFRRQLRFELGDLGKQLEAVVTETTDSKDRLRVVILAGDKRGEGATVPLDEIIFKRFLWNNFKKAWQAAPFARYFINSIFISILVTIGQVVTSALAAYAFARMRFRFKEFLFLVLLATMMIPKQVILIPDYAIISWLGWVNTYYALIVPFIAAVFGIYFMRQHFETLPQDLFDAASIDGCGSFRTLFLIVLPISKSVILTVALFTFIMTWNSLLWPLVMTNTPEMRPLQVGLAVFNQESGTDWELLMAASTFSIMPLMIIFFIAQKQFIEGITRSGMKG
ncbi:MAG: carbohydrate ABC transporter permease [Candidatus Euphemobacter frigidus]|nr:carbohydrate ABC transporter permease [Candidatus Euphemobacter frigidus]MDP8275441.1 carbohydrate ABC transporter permease [Candidatus Euphemobacter frigidus]